jgi:hypothetical protein
MPLALTSELESKVFGLSESKKQVLVKKVCIIQI